jgi:hypothetical protein
LPRDVILLFRVILLEHAAAEDQVSAVLRLQKVGYGRWWNRRHEVGGYLQFMDTVANDSAIDIDATRKILHRGDISGAWK